MKILLTIEELPETEGSCWDGENDGLTPSKSRPQPHQANLGQNDRSTVPSDCSLRDQLSHGHGRTLVLEIS